MGSGANARQNGDQGPKRRPGQDRAPRRARNGTGNGAQGPAQEPDAIPPNLTGRPKVEMTPDDYRQVEVLAGYGLTRPAIARVLGISVRTFERRLTDDPDLVAALDRGLAVAEAQVGEALFVLAIGESGTILAKDDQGNVMMDERTGKPKRVRIYKRLPDLGSIKWWEQTRAGRREVVRQETVSLDDEAGMSDLEVAQEVENIISLGAERVKRQRAGGKR